LVILENTLKLLECAVKLVHATAVNLQQRYLMSTTLFKITSCCDVIIKASLKLPYLCVCEKSHALYNLICTVNKFKIETFRI